MQTTFTRNLIDLVYEQTSRYFSKLERSGHEYRFILSERSPHDATTLARALRHSRLKAARADGNIVTAELSSGEPVPMDEFDLETGSFEQDSFTPDRLVLRRRRGTGIQRIEVLRVSSENEEWRRFLAREVDLVPRLSPEMLVHLREVPSVNVVPFRERPGVGLYFRTGSPIFRDASTRRAVAHRLRRSAVAALATGDPAAAVDAPNLPDDGLPPSPGPVRLVYHVGNVQHERAALVIEQQLLEMGFDVTVAALSDEGLGSALAAGSFDSMVFYGGLADRYLNMLVGPTSISGLFDDAFERAMAQGDMEAARAIVLREVPVTPLYAVQEAVAVDARFCGVTPTIISDFSWLADVHRCAPGETQ